MKIEISCKELPSPEDLKRIGEMLQEGYTSGINKPPGITWKVK